MIGLLLREDWTNSVFVWTCILLLLLLLLLLNRTQSTVGEICRGIVLGAATSTSLAIATTRRRQGRSQAVDGLDSDSGASYWRRDGNKKLGSPEIRARRSVWRLGLVGWQHSGTRSPVEGLYSATKLLGTSQAAIPGDWWAIVGHVVRSYSVTIRCEFLCLMDIKVYWSSVNQSPSDYRSLFAMTAATK